MNQSSTLLTFVSDALTAWDGIVEGKDKALACLLPSGLATQLSVEEDATLALPSAERGKPLIYGDVLFDNLIDLVQDQGRIAHVELKDLSAKSGGLRKELLRVVKLRNAQGDIKSVQSTTASYLLYHYQFEALCEDLQFGDFGTIALNEETLVSVPWLAEALPQQAVREISPLPWRTPHATIAGHVSDHVKEHVEGLLAPFKENIKQRISRMKRRLERQHRRERKLILAPLIEDPNQDQTAILAALKVAEQAFVDAVSPLSSLYEIHLNIQPFAIVRVTIPVTRVDYHIRRRKEERTIGWLWNPLIAAFEPQRCDNCGRETFHFSANDDLELHCRACEES